ncbi:MAG: hypothetical protein IJW08_02420 [Lentisphaeria bacterium]|nr:hypothetical protein [Lentisphaeria bacterium]
MKKIFLATFTALAVSATLGAFPLEWNINNKTDVPYEVEISRSKLEKLADANKNCGFEVTATTAQGKKKLDVTLLEGKLPGVAAIRFTVPAGTTALDCQMVENGKISTIGKLNLFDGVLADTSAWKATNRGSITKGDGKLIFKSRSRGETVFTCNVDVPEQYAGLGAKFELDFKSTAKETWSSFILIEQLDKNGKVLSESLTDPRWISLMRPYNILTPHRESGRFHSKVKKLRLVIKTRGSKLNIGSDGFVAKDPKVFIPAFEISRLSVRAAEEIPFPKYRDEFFSKGVSGKKGDYSFDTTKGKNGKAFFFATHSQACWAEGKTISNPQELFYPAGDGTVEAWFYPEWNKKATSATCTTLFTAEPTQFFGPMGAKRGRTKPCLALQYYPKRKQIAISFQDYTKKVYNNSFDYDFAEKKWSHVAVQWSVKGGIQVFINGSKVFEDTEFTYTPVDFNNPKIKKAKYRYIYIANEYMASQFSLGNTRYHVRSNKFPASHQHFRGKIDSLRISSVVRYKDNFTPAKKYTVDKDTRALFDFDRSFDGKTSDGLKHISGSVMAEVSRIEDRLTVNGKTIDYNPPKILDGNHPFKVLDIRNYTQVPNKKDFSAARKSEKVVFNFKGNAEKEIFLDNDVFMDYIEYKNIGNTTVVHPFMRRDSEIDPRSFADIRRTLDIANLTPRERTNKIFQFIISASDYFASHQLFFEPGTDIQENACYKALTMLNAYCGFECGPLNNLTANMFTCSGALPASQTGGYGHSFQQVWVDGKSNLYDMSAQKFFPSFDNTTPASLAEVELEPGIQNRVKGNSDHFIRLSTRTYTVQNPAYVKRVGMNIRPGETLRMWYSNNGRFNELQCHKDYSGKPINHLVHGKGKTKVVEKERIFPDFGSTFLFFNGKPAEFSKNFELVKADSFCYKVESAYPIVYAEYAAKLADGSFAELEISTDRGKTFRPLKSDADGTARPYYPVCGRMEYLIKVNAPIGKVENFNAMTQMITNPRVMTCKLKKGSNKLLYTASNNADIQLTLQYRKYAKDITITGESILTGSQRGYERQLTVLVPGESKEFSVTGISPAATVRTSGKLKAQLADGKLTISAPDEEIKAIEVATIIDNGAEKELTVLIFPNAEIVTAKDITPVKNAQIVDGDIQKSANFKGGSNKAKLRVNLKKSKPAGTYVIWNCVRFSIEPGWTRVHLELPQGGNEEVFRHQNSQSEFLKSRFHGANGRGKFYWTFAYDGYYTRLRHEMGKEFSHLDYRVNICNDPLAEVAGTLVLPDPGPEFLGKMVQILCGINNNAHYLNRNNN